MKSMTMKFGLALIIFATSLAHAEGFLPVDKQAPIPVVARSIACSSIRAALDSGSIRADGPETNQRIKIVCDGTQVSFDRVIESMNFLVQDLQGSADYYWSRAQGDRAATDKANKVYAAQLDLLHLKSSVQASDQDIFSAPAL